MSTIAIIIIYTSIKKSLCHVKQIKGNKYSCLHLEFRGVQTNIITIATLTVILKTELEEGFITYLLYLVFCIKNYNIFQFH